MNRGVVEFHSLTYSYRPCPKNYYLLLFGLYGSVFALIRRIEVRYIGSRMEGVRHPVDRRYGLFFSYFINLFFFLSPQPRYVLVGKAHGLGLCQRLFISGFFGKISFFFNYLFDRDEEEFRYLSRLVYLFHFGSSAQQLGDGEYVVVSELFYVSEKFLIRLVIEFLKVKVTCPRLEGTDGLKQTFFQI